MPCFKDVLEQNRAKNEIISSFSHQRLNHAYMLEGRSGIGKLTLARAVAARFLCHNPTSENDSCGLCESCRLLNGSTHPDFLELPRDSAELRIRRFTTRQTSGTEAIEHPPVLEFMRLKPMLGNRKVCIIPDIERINTEAANAFLKTLEEPPAQSLIILTCANKDQMLATINSRCRIINMQPLTSATISSELQKDHEISAQTITELTELSEGSLGKAKSMLNEDILDIWHEVCRINEFSSPAEAVSFAGTINKRIKSCKNSFSKRRTVLLYLELLAQNVRQQMRCSISAANSYKALQAIWQAAETIHYNVRPELVILNAVIKTVAATSKG